ncbi:MAG: hypothetical protein EZS28_006219 [Streblomastix strix]|uniref:Uncharacterized protein n=1 Tax=Streblomastix strix TaxID=222440 RepID=A0A5J4WT63_9EUKA|nr:MAG: hypothetical protein EZS28_006219 [Streblomastix strix]
MTEEGIANQSPVAPDPLYDLYPRGQSPISSERQSQSSHQQGTSEKLTIGADALSPIMSNNAQPIQQDQKDYKQYKLKYEQNDSNRNNEDEIEDGSV